MTKKCNGCGAVFQSLDSNLEGYIKEENILKSEICERCFRIKNYGDYKFIDKNNIDFINILKNWDFLMRFFHLKNLFLRTVMKKVQE